MNLIEAIKSGKRFRRLGDPDWVEVGKVQDWFRTIKLAALLADDWIVEPEPVKLTEKDYWVAVKNAGIPADHFWLLKDLARELGLTSKTQDWG